MPRKVNPLDPEDDRGRPLLNGLMVKRLRKARNWTVEEFAAKSDLDLKTLEKVERSSREKVEFSVSMRIHKALGLDLGTLAVLNNKGYVFINGLRVKGLRKARNWTLGGLAEKINADLKTVRRVERTSSTRVQQRIFERIVQILDVDPATLEADSVRELQTIGLDSELETIEAAIQHLERKRPSLILISGDSGVGKTHLRVEAGLRARDSGVLVITGNCYAEGAGPYRPWTEALNSYVRSQNSDSLKDVLRSDAGIVSKIATEIKPTAPDLQFSHEVGHEEARYQLFDAVINVLGRITASQRLLLVLEDLQWADDSSLKLLEFLNQQLARCNLVIIGTFRGNPLPSRLKESLYRLDRTLEVRPIRIQLKGWEEFHVKEFLLSVTTADDPGTVARLLYERTGGIPFFVKEIVQQQLDREQPFLVEDVRTTIELPTTLSDAINTRLGLDLTPLCNELLTLSSLLGPEFSVAALKHIFEDWSDDALVGALDEALGARIIEDSEIAGQYQFTHALRREAVAKRLSLAKRSLLHFRIANALKKLYSSSSSLGDHAGVIANHFEESKLMAGTRDLINFTILAGEHALGTAAYGEAATHFSRVVKLKEGEPPDEVLATSWYGLGRAQLATLEKSEIHRAVDSLRAAFDYFKKECVSKALAIAQYPTPEVDFPIQNPIPSEALPLVARGSIEEARLLSRVVHELGINEANQEDSERAFSRALEIAQREGDKVVESQIFSEGAVVDLLNMEFDRGAARARRAVVLAREGGDTWARMIGSYWLVNNLKDGGNGMREAAEAAADMWEAATEMGNTWWVESAIWTNAALYRLQGDWKKARDLSEEGLNLRPGDFKLLIGRILIEFEEENAAIGMEHLQRLFHRMEQEPPDVPTLDKAYGAVALPLMARIIGKSSPIRGKRVQNAANTVLSSSISPPLLKTMAIAGQALLAIQRGAGTEFSEENVATLKLSKRTWVLQWISTDRLLGLLFLAQGRFKEAIEQLRDAIEFCEKAGYNAELAWTSYDYAEALLRGGNSSSKKEGHNLLKKSLDMARGMGNKALTRRIRILERQNIIES